MKPTLQEKKKKHPKSVAMTTIKKPVAVIRKLRKKLVKTKKKSVLQKSVKSRPRLDDFQFGGSSSSDSSSCLESSLGATYMNHSTSDSSGDSSDSSLNLYHVHSGGSDTSGSSDSSLEFVTSQKRGENSGINPKVLHCSESKFPVVQDEDSCHPSASVPSRVPCKRKRLLKDKSFPKKGRAAAENYYDSSSSSDAEGSEIYYTKRSSGTNMEKKEFEGSKKPMSIPKSSDLSADEDDCVEENEYDAIRKEISNMPFDELQKLKERVGMKAYNQALFGDQKKAERKKSFKRANKNRPMEMSSKFQVPRYQPLQQEKGRVTRDPRFDDLSGSFDERLFQQAYGFIDDIKSREKEKLQKKLKTEKDPKRQEDIKFLINRMTQQEKTAREKQRKMEIDRTLKKKEKELVQEGKKAFFLKKSERRKLELAEKYKQLKKSGKLEKYLSRKRKKVASKDRKHLPYVQS